MEHTLRRLKGRTLSIAPVYVRDEKQIRGLLCLLAIALRVLTLVEYTVHRALQAEGAMLKGVSPVYPTRVTDHPSAELILSAFKPIELVIVELAGNDLSGCRTHTDAAAFASIDGFADNAVSRPCSKFVKVRSFL